MTTIMGEDIHQRCFCKLKKSGQYINAHEICAWDPKYTAFEELVPDRNYELFSLFGSMRGNYKPLSNANYGMPDFLKGSAFQEYCDEMCYYGFIWFKLPEFLDAVNEYLKKLKNPLKYLDEDDNEQDSWISLLSAGTKTEADMHQIIDSLDAWHKSHENIVCELERIREQLAKLPDHYKDSVYDKLIDIGETVFLFFFDN